MMVDESGKAIKQQTVVQTEKVETETFKKSITKTIKCPSCGEIKEVQGVIGERITIICPKCNTKGVFQFR
jgi:Zn finger protein HypA/HybF involved in hydrogenase expression